MSKNRHERRKEDAEKRRENRQLRRLKNGYQWRKSANNEWCWTYDEDSDETLEKETKSHETI